MTPTTARIDFSRPREPGAPRLRHAFGAPRKVLAAATLQAVRPVLDAVHAAAAQGFWCVGYVCYEAAAAFDAALRTHPPQAPGTPHAPALAWFAVYDGPGPWPDDGGAPAAEATWQEGLQRGDFDAAMAINPDQPEAWLNKGIALYQQGQPAAALPYFEGSIARRTSYQALAYYARGLANEDTGNIRAAYSDLRRAQALSPKWAAPKAELARYQVRQR